MASRTGEGGVRSQRDVMGSRIVRDEEAAACAWRANGGELRLELPLMIDASKDRWRKTRPWRRRGGGLHGKGL